MKSTESKQIKLALVAMIIIFFGTEIIIAYVSKEAYSTNQIRPWFAIVIGAIYYVIAHQISEINNKRKYENE